MSNVLKGSISAEGTMTGNLATVFGVDGKSAYQVAVDNGFKGTEAEWLESLKAAVKLGSLTPDYFDRTYLEWSNRTSVNTYADLDNIIESDTNLNTAFTVMFSGLSPIKSVVGDGTFFVLKSNTSESLLLINVDNGEMWRYTQGANEVTRASVTKEDLENLDIDNSDSDSSDKWRYYKVDVYTLDDLDMTINHLTGSTVADAHQVMLRFHVPYGSELADRVQEGVCIGIVDIEHIDATPVLRFINLTTGVIWRYRAIYDRAFEIISGSAVTNAGVFSTIENLRAYEFKENCLYKIYTPSNSSLTTLLGGSYGVYWLALYWVDYSDGNLKYLTLTNLENGRIGTLCVDNGSWDERYIEVNDGFSPTAKVTQTTDGATITITDKDGTTTANIVNGKDGKDGTDGQDGYTPIKGVDYFDGKDGADGTDGQDGKDGYTPQKGIDYFDGADGKDGVDGNDGYTPIKGVDYFDGADGKDGTNGGDGKSAFEIALDNGFEGTETEWLESLKGSSGVYVGSGEMPDDCNVQINPDGVATTIEYLREVLKPTGENINTALGYIPANQTAVDNLSKAVENKQPAGDYALKNDIPDIRDKIDKPSSGVVGQVLAVKSVDDNGKPTEFACVYQTGGSGAGGETEVVEKTFKVWGPNATSTADGDIITELNSGYYDKNGVQVETGTFGCTVPLIEINEDATIYAYNLYDFEAGYAITFFDKNKAVISGVGGTGSTSVRITGNQTVPSGACYVAVTLLKADPGMYCQITTRETVVTDSLGTQLGFLETEVAELKAQAQETAEKVNSMETETETLDYGILSSCDELGYYDVNGTFQSTTSWRCTNYIPVSAGDKLTVKLTTYSTTSAIAYFDENKKFISGVIGNTWSWNTSVYPLNGERVVPEGAYFMRVSVFVADYATEQYVTIERSVLNGVKNNLDIINGKALNVLILGDSYSEMGRWVRYMKEVIEVNDIVNLGVSSATLKDRYADRTTYPYSDRPNTADGSGNTNTLSSQIQRLKRLMAGTDLDSGETQIYATEAEYPDVIIIEGGMNDAPDTEEVVKTYQNQFLVSKTAYYKLNSSATATQTTVWVKPSLDTIDRTCFAGAYRYLCEELLALFPKAQIFITTASHTNYFTVNPNVRYGDIAEQQRKCANIMSYTVIDWHAEGNLNTMMIGLNGSGTQSDPYTPVGGNEYTTDLLHPNDEGAKRYGRLAGKVIMQKFLGFN